MNGSSRPPHQNALKPFHNFSPFSPRAPFPTNLGTGTTTSSPSTSSSSSPFCQPASATTSKPSLGPSSCAPPCTSSSDNFESFKRRWEAMAPPSYFDLMNKEILHGSTLKEMISRELREALEMQSRSLQQALSPLTQLVPKQDKNNQCQQKIVEEAREEGNRLRGNMETDISEAVATQVSKKLVEKYSESICDTIVERVGSKLLQAVGEKLDTNVLDKKVVKHLADELTTTLSQTLTEDILTVLQQQDDSASKHNSQRIEKALEKHQRASEVHAKELMHVFSEALASQKREMESGIRQVEEAVREIARSSRNLSSVVENKLLAFEVLLAQFNTGSTIHREDQKKRRKTQQRENDARDPRRHREQSSARQETKGQKELAEGRCGLTRESREAEEEEEDDDFTIFSQTLIGDETLQECTPTDSQSTICSIDRRSILM